MSGPTITERLFRARTDELIQSVEEALVSANTDAAKKYARQVAGQIRNAYVRGLQDGFAQGAAHADAGEQ